MTDDLTAELARLNKLDAKRHEPTRAMTVRELVSALQSFSPDYSVHANILGQVVVGICGAVDIGGDYFGQVFLENFDHDSEHEKGGKFSKNRFDAIALANKLHAENERLKALLVECEEILEVYQHSDEVIGGCNNGEAFQMLEKLHAAGIGGEHG